MQCSYMLAVVELSESFFLNLTVSPDTDMIRWSVNTAVKIYQHAFEAKFAKRYAKIQLKTAVIMKSRFS